MDRAAAVGCDDDAIGWQRQAGTVLLFRARSAFLSPRAYTAGQGFNVSGPYPGAPTFKPTTPDEARAKSEPESAEVDFLKIWMTNPMFSPEVIAAIVDEGEKQQIPIVSHVTDVASLHQLADLGVTDFLHNPRDQPVTPSSWCTPGRRG